MARKKKRSAAQLAATKKLVALNKKRRKKKTVVKRKTRVVVKRKKKAVKRRAAKRESNPIKSSFYIVKIDKFGKLRKENSFFSGSGWVYRKDAASWQDQKTVNEIAKELSGKVNFSIAVYLSSSKKK